MNVDNLPPRFRELGLPAVRTGDGFWMSRKSLAEILLEKDIRTFPNDQGQTRECGLFFDDWYLYAVDAAEGWVYSLVKLREQEHDAERGRIADGDTPGVTVSFIAFRTEALVLCLENACPENRNALSREINRVVSLRGQRHHPALKRYFLRTQSLGAYLIAREYVRKVASLATEGTLAVPEAYRKARPRSRLHRFIEETNAAAGYTVCDHETIFIQNADAPSPQESLAILATHTGDTSLHSFAAEVQFHAWFLTPLARIPIPFLGRSIYDSAIRADMTIDNCDLAGPAPYHNPGSRWVRQQMQCHPEDTDPRE